MGDHLWADGRYREWVVVAMFYEALQWVDSLFAAQGRRPGDHRERGKMVRTHLRPIASNYMRLYDDSRAARYECHSFGDGELIALSVARDNIRTEVQQRLRTP